MRNPVRGWRSARGLPVQVSAGAPAPAAVPPIVAPQEPLRIGLGLIALVFYLWIIHSYKVNAGDVAVLALGAGVVMRGGTIRIPGPLQVFGLFILWAALGFTVTRNFGTTLESLIAMSKLWIIAFCVVNVIRNASELRFLAIAWLGVFALYPIRGALYNQYICRCNEFGRVAWNFVFENPNDLAALCLIPLGVAAGIGYVERVRIWRYSGMIGVGVLALIIMLTQSRGAMLAMGVSAILLPLTSRRRGRDLVILALMMGGAAMLAPKAVWNRLGGLANASVERGMQGVDQEGSAEARWKLWQLAITTIKANPATGVGLGMMPETSRWLALSDGLDWTVRGERDTHSTYLRVTAETGFPGLFLYLLMWGTVLFKLRSTRKRIRHVRHPEHQFLLFLELSIIAFLLASIFGTYDALSFTYIMLGFSWLAADILGREPWYVPNRAGSMMVAPAPVRRSRSG